MKIYQTDFHMTSHPPRWTQRLQNLELAFLQLSVFLKQKELNPLEEQGLIKLFEYNYELAWNTIKDFYEAQGESGIQGSRDAKLNTTNPALDRFKTWNIFANHSRKTGPKIFRLKMDIASQINGLQKTALPEFCCK